MIRKENKLTKQREGLPEVAEKIQVKKPIILIMMGVVIISVLGIYFHNKSTRNMSQPIEESYAIQIEDMNERKATTSKNENETSELPKQISQENQKKLKEQIAFIQQKQKELQQRLAAPLMVVNNESMLKEDAKNNFANSIDSNMQFLAQASSEKHVNENATAIGPLNSMIAEGSLIHAILESATNSDLPGYLRAIVSEPAYSEDGSQLLIPRGSRLIGQYKSGMQQGQSRIFIAWTRLIIPGGISINLGSTSVDNLGVAGIGADEVDRHFWSRFGTASLLSIIGAGAANVGVSDIDRENSSSAYRSAVANSFAQSADQSLQQDRNIPPTLKTYQGKPIIVFVAHDLHFESVNKQVNSKINII